MMIDEKNKINTNNDDDFDDKENEYPNIVIYDKDDDFEIDM